MISLILEKKLPTKKITWHFFMLNVRKKYFCLFQELFNVNLSSNFCVKYINNFQDIVKFVQFSFLKKWENENDLDLFLNGPNFMRNGIIISALFIKAIFLNITYQKGGISFSPRSMHIRPFAKVLILMIRICLPLVLRNNYSLNALNFRRLLFCTDKK